MKWISINWIIVIGLIIIGNVVGAVGIIPESMETVYLLGVNAVIFGLAFLWNPESSDER